MADEPTVRFEVEDGVGMITIVNPDRLNAVTGDMGTRIVEILREARTRDDVRALVLTGEGRAFCAGAQLGQTYAEPDRTRLKTALGSYAEVTRMLVAVDKPVIAAIHGVCVGLGFSWALACDRRIADSTARPGAIWVKRGIMPDVGVHYFLPRIVGLSRALHLLESGEFVPVDEAYRIGLVDEVVPEGMDVAAAKAYAANLAKGASVVVDLTRRGVYQGLNSTLDEVIDYEAWASEVSLKTADRAEGRVAFFEKRDARYIGR